uniref:xanthine dehydrogenase subunit XdhA n=1 Tax=Ndongobacter massiliensis TaxID=1871025 RepID=UPI000930D82C|nr:xanthine dehydrogenase subunit XdhA [Ndongobacter massiliensis]
MGVKDNVKRVDAVAKVTGQAKYTEDLVPFNALVVRLVHSTIANGIVKFVDIEEAKRVPGVELIVTCFDVPEKQYATCGHPHSIDPSHKDVANRNMLTKKVRYYGDEIAAVVAENKIAADRAIEKIRVEYEEFPVCITAKDCLNSPNVLHEAYDHNVLARMDFSIENSKLNFYSGAFSEDRMIKGADVEGSSFYSQVVQHVHIENICCFVYMEGGRYIVVSPNQAPHTLRHHIADAIGKPLSSIKVKKPYIGGGFGSKQDTFNEPLLCFLSEKLGGRCVYIAYDREETFVNSRIRHPMEIMTSIKVNDAGKITDRFVRIHSNAGAYGSNGHSVTAYAVTNFFAVYPALGKQIGESMSYFSNLPTSGAMRGYGIPQITFAVESQMDDIAYDKGWDPVQFRLDNIVQKGFFDPFDRFYVESNGLRECILKGAESIDWDNKEEEYRQFNAKSSNLKKGVGMAVFAYKTGVYPVQIETASSRLLLNEDGTLLIQTGATELGQGSDTVMTQMASSILTIPENKIGIVSMQDTDVSPHDAGAYASRQSYVSGGAVKKAALLLKEKILKYAAQLSNNRNELILEEEQVKEKDGKKLVMSIAEVALRMQYENSTEHDTQHITAEATFTARSNCFSYGASFVDLEVDLGLGLLNIKKIVATHDSGQILNKKLAEGQVRGGVIMGLGQAIGEELLFNETTGKPYNNNLLDYKIPTAMDIPNVEVHFIETWEPSGPFGNKSLGEPPIIAQSPAIRNAILHATGVKLNRLPLNPEYLVHEFKKNKLI